MNDETKPALVEQELTEQVENSISEIGPPISHPPQIQNESMLERMAMNPDVDVDKFERLMAMQERVMDREAEMLYVKAMIAVQREVEAITRDKLNPNTHSRFASLEAMKKAVVPVYTEHGFALSYGEGETTKEKMVRVTCKVMHLGGHSENFFYDCPIDDAGIKGAPNKTPTHGKASGVSYGERYILKLIFNLTIQDEDDDGNAAGGNLANYEKISESQVNELDAKIRENGIEMAGFMTWLKTDLGCDKIEDIRLKSWRTVNNRIKSAIRYAKNGDKK